MSVLTAHFLRLTDFLDGKWPPFLPPPGDLAVMEHLHIAPLSQVLEDDEAKLITNLYFSREVVLQLPGIDHATVAIVLGRTGALIGIEINLHPAFTFRLVDVPLTLRMDSIFFQPVRPLPDGSGYQPDPEGHAEIAIQGTIRMDSGGIAAESIEFSTPPLMIGTTGVVLQAEQCRLILAEPSGAALTALNTLGFDSAFRGVYAKQARFHWLPQMVLNGANTPGLNLNFSNAAIGVSHDQVGLSCELNLTWPVDHVDGVFTPDTELQGYFLHPSWAVALSSLRVKVRRNQFQSFLVQGMIRVPLLDSLFSASFGANADGTVQLTLLKAETGLRHIDWLPTAQFTLNTFHASGVAQQNDFKVKGDLSGSLNLSGVGAMTLDLVRFELGHSPAQDSLLIDISDLSFGPLGRVETAKLQIESTYVANAGGKKISLQLETTLSWEDLRQRLKMDQLPDRFPLPPDGAQVTAYLSWQDNGAGAYQLLLRFTAELSDLDSIWSFIPEDFRPDAQNARFTFATTYANGADFENASTSDTFVGDVSVEMQLRLPEFPAVPGAELFEVDRQQWVKASLKGGVRSVNGVDEGYMEMAISDAPAVKINFPGLAQAEPPIEIEIKTVEFDLKVQPGADSLTGHLSLDGDFLLRPINPAESNLPVPPAMAAHMEKLFKAAGLSEFGGTAKFDLKFKGNKAAVDLSVAFDQAKVELDLFDMIAGVSRGMAAPQGMDGSANSIDLDIEVDIRLREIKIQFGSIEDNAPTDQSHFGFALALDATLAGVQVDEFSIQLSDQEFSFGFDSLAVPVALPHFPIGLNDLNPLRDSSGAWDYTNLWQQGERPRVASAIALLKEEIATLKSEPATNANSASIAAQLRAKRTALFEQTARQFLIDSIFAVYQLVGPTNRAAYQTLIEAYMTLMDATLHQFAFDTTLDFVLRDVRFVLPFHNPTDIRVEGGAQLAGFKPDDPLAPLGDLVFKLGLSAEYIYFNVEGGEPIPLPLLGTYRNDAGIEEAKVSLKLNHARIGYGYSKNALVAAFAGELKIAKPLADDLNTADTLGFGVRLPERTKLGFKLDLIPIVLGEVDFLLPLFEFDIDLRKEYSPGITDSATCAPFWDGLQLIVPNIIRQDFKRLRFAPFFGSLLAPNYNTSFDLMLGDAHNGLTYVCNEYLVIVPTSAYTVIPLLADGTPFFNNLCTNIRLAGFGVNFDLQRPFPSMSPLALFEIFGLLADPMMPVDPDGALANTIRATIQNARITLPPALVRMFPEHGTVLTREVNYTINLATLIAVTQAIAGPVGKILNQAQATTGAIGNLLEEIQSQPPDLSPSALLALLPPELRRCELHGSFAGFDASAVFALLTPDEAARAFAQRDKPTAVRKPRLVVDERFDDPALSGWDVLPPRARSTWQLAGGALRQSGRSDVASYALYKNHYDDVSFTAVLAAEGDKTIGLIFGYQDEKNHYRFEMNPAAKVWQLTKVRNARATVLQQLPQQTERRRSYTVTVTSESTASIPPGGPAIAVVRLVIGVDGSDAFDLYDAIAPVREGRLGVTCQAGAAARFDSVRIHRLGAPQPPLPGEYLDPAWLTSFQPNFSKPAAPLYDPTAAANSLLKSAPFDAFDAASLAALPVPSTGASGVLVGAEVKVLDDQRFGFLGYLLTDGTFSLTSALDVTPLRLAIAGIAVELPLEVHGRLMLEGRAQGAQSYAKVRAQVSGAWQPLPGVVELTAGSKSKPIELTLAINGRFALRGNGGLKLFNGAAVLNGTVDISHTHCFVNGTFDYKPDFTIGTQGLIDLSLSSTGRIGPANTFEISGAGTLKILGKSFSQVRGSVSDTGVELEARLDSGGWNWNGIDVKACSLALTGKIDLTKPGAPSFLLQGDGKVRLFGAATSKARAEISGRGGIRAEAGEITQFIEGSLYWQGREWLGGRLELGTQHISVQGRTAFALDLTPTELPTGIQLANLFFRVELAGGFQLTKTGGLQACNLDVDWSLAVKMPGIEQQFPIAMQKKRFSYAAGQTSQSGEIELLPLLNIDGALFLPLEKLTLPIPIVSADQYTQYYWYWDDIAQSSQLTYKKVNVENSGSSDDPRFPSAVGKTGDLNIAQRIASAFGLGNPPVSVNVPTYGVTGWKYIKLADEDVDLPAIRVPRVAASVPASIPANQKFALFQLPTHFTADLGDGANMLKALRFAIALTWKDGKLGLTVARDNSKKFTAFERMFE